MDFGLLKRPLEVLARRWLSLRVKTESISSEWHRLSGVPLKPCQKHRRADGYAPGRPDPSVQCSAFEIATGRDLPEAVTETLAGAKEVFIRNRHLIDFNAFVCGSI